VNAPEFAAADLHARLDGLRTFADRALADEFRDPRIALEQLTAALGALIRDNVPDWCPGCPGCNAGTVCRTCRLPVRAALRSRRGDVPEKVLAS
jgi:hypothetical protein